MAFVFQTQRKINEVSKLTNPTGPGQYFQQKSQRKLQISAPFNSTGMRKTLFDQKPLVKAGPGQYDIAKNIIQPNIKTVSNIHSIIVKINSTGTSQFKSARQRFRGDQTEVPGPGSYAFDGMRINRNSFTKSSPSASASKRLKALTHSLKKYPAIPEKVRGLTDMKNEKQIPDQQKLGPCHYNPDKKAHLNLTSTVWGKDKTKRFSLDKTTNVGPGKYKLDFSQIGGQYPQPSGTFKSATVRTYFQSLYYKTNLDKTARQRQSNQILFKTKDPAPGQYQVNHSSFKIKEIPFSFQFFGSTVERFTDQLTQEKPKTSTFYNIGSNIGKNRSFNKGIHGFNSQSNRRPQFLNVRQNQTAPGPGHYKENIVVQKKLRGINPQKFGSTTNRPLLQKQEKDQLGPGKYFNQDNSQEDQIMKNRSGRLKQTSGNFKSTTGRNCFGTIKSNVPLAEYDLTQTDISTKIQKQRNYLQNLRKIQVQKAPFESSNTRFPHYDQVNSPKQKKPSVDDINKQHEQKIREQSQKTRQALIQFNKMQLKQKQIKGHFGKSQRFGDAIKGAPGVGQYTVQGSFERKTYNVKYVDSPKK